MADLIVVPKGTEWRRLKALVLDSVSSPITKRVYNLGLDEFFAWYKGLALFVKIQQTPARRSKTSASNLRRRSVWPAYRTPDEAR